MLIRGALDLVARRVLDFLFPENDFVSCSEVRIWLLLQHLMGFAEASNHEYATQKAYEKLGATF